MQSLAPPSTSYTAPAVISLGEEYTDASLPSSSTSSRSFQSEHNSGYDEELYYSSSSDSETDSDDSDDSDYSPISPSDGGNSAAAPQHNRRRSSIVPALWHAEHARLLSLQTAVLDNERAAWTREKRLESEVARIKVDLARLQQKQQPISNPQNDGPFSSLNSVRTSAPTEAILDTPPNTPPSTPPRCAGPRGPRPKPQQLRSPAQTRTTIGTTSESGPPLLPKFSFESLTEPSAQQAKPEPEQTSAVTVLSHHLIQARSQRAQERQRRRNEHERMRELATLLTLGSEVRKWEERLAWSQFHSTTRAAASDDSHLNTESVAKAANNNNNNIDIDPRGKRLSRSSSLPSNRMSYVPPPPSSQQQQQPNSRQAPLSPALPSLALSPLWRVSAEMILRRRQLSERPRRTPPAPLVANQISVGKVPVVTTPVPVQVPVVPSLMTTTQTQATTGTTLARPAHTLRGPRDKRTISSTTTSSPISAPSSTGTATPTLATSTSNTSSGSGSLSVKRNSVPPPISIPPSASFCSTTAITSANNGTATSRLGAPTGTCTFLFSKTTPVRPSALKWAFTADDLAREMQEEETRRKEQVAAALALTNSSVPAQTCCAESSSESSEGDSGSDSSGKSSSDGSGSSSSGQECAPVVGGGVERRGRARFSWRKSIPKDGSASGNANIPPTPPIASVNVET